MRWEFKSLCPCQICYRGGTGIHAGLRCLYSTRSMRVRIPPVTPNCLRPQTWWKRTTKQSRHVRVQIPIDSKRILNNYQKHNTSFNNAQRIMKKNYSIWSISITDYYTRLSPVRQEFNSPIDRHFLEEKI